MWTLSFTACKAKTSDNHGPAQHVAWDTPCKHEVSCPCRVVLKERTETVVELVRRSILPQGSPFRKFLEDECTESYRTALVFKIAHLCQGSLTTVEAFHLSPAKREHT